MYPAITAGQFPLQTFFLLQIALPSSSQIQLVEQTEAVAASHTVFQDYSPPLAPSLKLCVDMLVF